MRVVLKFLLSQQGNVPSMYPINTWNWTGVLFSAHLCPFLHKFHVVVLTHIKPTQTASRSLAMIMYRRPAVVHVWHSQQRVRWGLCVRQFQCPWRRWLEWSRAECTFCHESPLRTQTKSSQVGSSCWFLTFSLNTHRRSQTSTVGQSDGWLVFFCLLLLRVTVFRPRPSRQNSGVNSGAHHSSQGESFTLTSTRLGKRGAALPNAGPQMSPRRHRESNSTQRTQSWNHPEPGSRETLSSVPPCHANWMVWKM